MLYPASIILAIVTMATTELNPFLEHVQHRTSVGAIMSIFLWREMKRTERYEKLLFHRILSFHPSPICHIVALA